MAKNINAISVRELLEVYSNHFQHELYKTGASEFSKDEIKAQVVSSFQLTIRLLETYGYSVDTPMLVNRWRNYELNNAQ